MTKFISRLLVFVMAIAMAGPVAAWTPVSDQVIQATNSEVREKSKIATWQLHTAVAGDSLSGWCRGYLENQGFDARKVKEVLMGCVRTHIAENRERFAKAYAAFNRDAMPRDRDMWVKVGLNYRLGVQALDMAKQGDPDVGIPKTPKTAQFLETMAKGEALIAELEGYKVLAGLCEGEEGCSELRANVDRMLTDLYERDGAIARVDNEIGLIRSELAALTARVEMLEAAVEQHEQRLLVLEGRVPGAVARVE